MKIKQYTPAAIIIVIIIISTIALRVRVKCRGIRPAEFSSVQGIYRRCTYIRDFTKTSHAISALATFQKFASYLTNPPVSQSGVHVRRWCKAFNGALCISVKYAFTCECTYLGEYAK